MKFKEFGNQNLPTMIFLHGGGLSWWSLEKIVNNLKNDYHIVTPIIDGHGDDSETTFKSIEDSARKLMNYIDINCKGKVFFIGGLSIGAQIVVEVLSRRKDIAEFAVIESGLVLPIAYTNLMVSLSKVTYGLINKKWFSKAQAKSLYVPKDMFDKYYEESCKMSKESLANITRSNGKYIIKESIKYTQAKVLVIVGEKELKIMKESAIVINDAILDSNLYVAKGMNHGEFSLLNSDLYIQILRDFIMEKEVSNSF